MGAQLEWVRRMGSVALVVAVGCGGNKTPPVAAAEPVPAPAPVVAPEPEPEPVPEPEPEVPPSARPHNADFGAAIAFADGSSLKGKVVRVERTNDWYGDEGWSDEASDLVVNLEGGGTEIDAPWTNIASIAITYGAKGDVDCSYDSSFEPAMYSCVLRTTTKVKTKDGKAWDGADRHKWLFVFESGDVAEFYVYKLPARKQETEVPELGTVEENTKLYEDLQIQLDKEKLGKVPKSITITAP